MLEIKNLQVNYGAIAALHGVSLQAQAGGIVTLIGSNGAGKTTTLKTISGLLKPKAGEILYEGRNIAGLPPHEIVKRGLSHVPEGRMIFANLTVLENLHMGGYLQPDKASVRRELELVFAVFPRLQERAAQIGGTLSGGEQQMLAIGRALMARPKFLMLDEPSLGLAPLGTKRQPRAGNFQLWLCAGNRQNHGAGRLGVAPPECAGQASLPRRKLININTL
jgi:branched-chain amino acid transport system ATP-binding protein